MTDPAQSAKFVKKKHNVRRQILKEKTVITGGIKTEDYI